MLKLFKPAFGLLALVIMLVPACYKAEPTPRPVKSENDQRQYRYLTLDNQMQVLLISDPGADKAAVSLDVNVGSRQDPQDYQGLAHFLEHMLFLGTDKYPEADDYQNYISSHSGNHNAYTAFEHTNYFFDIDSNYLEPALDRFSRFFIAPLFTAEYVDREKNAVHSEYTAKIKDERRKALDILKQVINPEHPFAKLSVGNLETLKDREPGSLRKQLLDFHRRYYSANQMVLVVLANESLDELQTIVLPKFTEVVNHKVEINPISTPLFKPDQLPLKLSIRPEKQQRQLTITFPTPEEMPYYRQKPMHFIGNVVGHEGEGSLLSYLKRKGWAEGLSAGGGFSYSGGSSFSVTIKLTKAGVENYPSIVEAVFQTLNRIRNNLDGHSLFDEQKAIAEQSFRFKESSSPVSYARRLANDLHYYPIKDLLQGSFMMEQYAPDLIRQFLDQMTPENSLVSLTAPNLATNQVSPWYQAPYGLEPIAHSEVVRWKGAGLNDQITMPSANEFIAEDFQLIKKPTTKLAKPEQVLAKERFRLWYQPDGKFGLPKASVFFDLRFPGVQASPEQAAQLRLYAALLNDQLNEFSYPASLAGLQYSLRSHGRGLSVKINGFSDKQDLLLDKILQVLSKPEFNKQRFTELRNEKIRQLRNVNKQQPYHRLMSTLPQLLVKNSWSEQQLIEAYQSIDVETLKQFAQQLLSKVDINMLVYGNYERRKAVSLAAQVEKELVSSKGAVNIPPVSILKFDDQLMSHEIESAYRDASAMLYLQAGNLGKSTRALMGISAQIMRAEFYNQLRTEKQLGYIVTSGAYPLRDVPGLFFLVQSPVAGPEQLQHEIESYLSDKKNALSEMDEQQFKRHQQALIVRLQENPKNPFQQAQRFWNDINEGYRQFDSRQQLIDAIAALSFEQWKTFFEQEVLGSNNKLWLYNRGQYLEQSIKEGHVIKEMPVFKSRQAYYTFP